MWFFPRFDSSENVSGFSQAKSSVIRGIKSKLVDQYPLLADYINDIIPKKEPLNIMKWCVDHVISDQSALAKSDLN